MTSEPINSTDDASGFPENEIAVAMDQLLKMQTKRAQVQEIVAIFHVILGSLGVCTNAIFITVLGTMFARKKLSWKRFWLVLNGGILDFVSGALLMVVGAIQIYYRNEPHNAPIPRKLVRELAEVSESMVVLVPAVNYLAICIFQYAAISHPIHYATRVTKRKYIAIIISEWTLVVLTAVVAVTKLPLSQQTDKKKTKDTALTYEGLKTVYMIAVTLGLTAIFLLVLLARLRKKRGIEVTLEHFVKNFGINVIIFVVALYALFVTNLIRWPFYYAYISGNMGGNSGNILAYLRNLHSLLQINAVSGIITVVCLSRIVADPIVHCCKHAVIRRHLCRLLCCIQHERVLAGYFPMQYVPTRV